MPPRARTRFVPRAVWLLLLLIPGVAGLPLASTADAVDPSDPDLLYTGRWDHSSPSAPWAQAQLASVTANFEGTSLSATFDAVSNEYFRVILDGDAASSVRMTFASGVPTVVASGLADAVHRVDIVKESDQDRASFLGFQTDSGRGLVAPPPRPARRIVFYGDSNLAGYSLGSERNEGDAEFIGSYYGYAGIVGRMFDAESHNISKNGTTIVGLKNAFDRIDWDSPTPAWNFGLFPADVVVANIGANDEGRPKGFNKANYHALFGELRTAHPSAHIMLFNAYGWDESEPANYTHEVIAERIANQGDTNISSAVFPWVFEQFHGCETDHAGMALHLARHLETVMGWTAGPSDVVSGYGMDGQLGNASFEGVAPFGGWGWRYFDDAGVQRVYDPVGAVGDYYLRLSDGATAQQTNPASDGEEITISVWMRGEEDGDEVDITLSFRDQQAGGSPVSSPMQSDTETKVLTSYWRFYQMTATAPINPSNPVYSVRVHFEAGPSSTADIDGVMVPEPGRWILLVSGLAGLRALASRRSARLAIAGAPSALRRTWAPHPVLGRRVRSIYHRALPPTLH